MTASKVSGMVLGKGSPKLLGVMSLRQVPAVSGWAWGRPQSLIWHC